MNRPYRLRLHRRRSFFQSRGVASCPRSNALIPINLFRTASRSRLTKAHRIGPSRPLPEPAPVERIEVHEVDVSNVTRLDFERGKRDDERQRRARRGLK